MWHGQNLKSNVPNFHFEPLFIIMHSYGSQISINSRSVYPVSAEVSCNLEGTNAMPYASLVAQTVKNLPVNAEDLGSIPGLGRSPGEGNGNPLQYSCLENSTDCSPPCSPTGGLASMQLQRVRHDWATNTFTSTVPLLVMRGTWFSSTHTTWPSAEMFSFASDLWQSVCTGSYCNLFNLFRSLVLCVLSVLRGGIWNVILYSPCPSWVWQESFVGLFHCSTLAQKELCVCLSRLPGFGTKVCSGVRSSTSA